MEEAEGRSSTGNTKTCAKLKKTNGYFLTIWNENYPTELTTKPMMQYLVTCKDVCPKTGKKHAHAFVYFKNPVSFGSIKKLFGNDAHVKKPIRNSLCINYVLGKSGRPEHDANKYDFTECGKRPMDNGVHRMEEVLECKDVTEVMETMPDTYVKYRKGIIDLMEHKKSKERYFKPPEVIYIYGSTGKGKTRRAFEDGAVNVTYENGFFSDWKDARVICIEEFRGQIPYSEMLKLLDGYHNYYFVNIKGGQKFIDLDKIYITSPYSVEDCYPRQNQKIDSIEQIKRRITEWVCVDL